MFWAIFTILVFALLWCAVSAADLRTKEKNAQQCLTELRTALTDRYALLNELKKAAGPDVPVLPELRAGMRVDELNRLSWRLDALCGEMLEQAEQQPKAAETLPELRRALEAAEARLRTRRQGYNRAANSFNSALIAFPARYFAGGRLPLAFFEADAFHYGDDDPDV